MKTQQFTYPFASNRLATLSNVRYCQIGVERPFSIPLSAYDDSSDGTGKKWSDVPLTLRITIDGIDTQTYTIPDKGILEFGDMYVDTNYQTLDIRILEPENPYVIIDLAYETV